MDKLIDALTRLDPKALWLFITDILRNPTTNTRAFTLILAGISILVILVILLVTVGIMSLPEDEEEDGYEDEEGETPQLPTEGRAAAVARAEVEDEIEYEPAERTPRERLVVTLVWVLAFAAVWVAGGIATRQESVCVSCHINEKAHALRLKDPGQDPHGNVSCSSCHESSNTFAAVTVGVPGRAVHFVAGFLNGSLAKGYGTPVANSTCTRCHESVLVGTFKDGTRGIRMSHKEPLRAKARCTDCHALRPSTGVVDRFTVGMEPCLRCHDQKRASAECSYCHVKDIGYAMQSRGVPEATAHDGNIDCGGCHSQKTCDNCHQMRMPHTQQFKGSGHAREAVLDLWYNGGRTCRRCHTDKVRSCGKCHVGKFPSHGVGSWDKQHQHADPDNNGCDNCHGYRAWMVGRNMCANCHDDMAEIRRKQKELARPKAVTRPPLHLND